MEVVKTPIEGVLLIKPQVFGDERGYFVETWQKERYEAAGINLPFVQDNHSKSTKGILRGLHFQKQHPQGKLVMVSLGEVFDVAVDIRKGSPTFHYKCTDFYHPGDEGSIRWNDPTIGIDWPYKEEPVLSAKDQIAPFFKDALEF